uniref:Uncharacterized protein n=1 Tax=Opuntia streptacantha TaxID=393608 RepID=A0A7C9CHX1_OPUST
MCYKPHPIVSSELIALDVYANDEGRTIPMTDACCKNHLNTTEIRKILLAHHVQMIHLQVRTMSRYKSNIPQENKWSANWHVEVYDVQQGRAAAPTIIMSG